MKQYLLFVFLAFTATTAIAQFKTVANHDSIVLKQHSFYVGSEKYRYGFMNRNLGNALKISPEATGMFKQSRRTYGKALLVTVPAAVMCLAGAYGYFDNNKLNNGLIYGSIPVSAAGIYFSIKSYKQLKQAVHIRNQN